MASNKELGAKSEKRVTFKDDIKLNTQQVSVPSRIPVRANSVSRHSCSSRTGAIKKTPKKSQAKKSLVRNVEQPVSVSRHKGLSQCVDVHSLYSTTSSKTSDLGEPPHKYAVPELYTTLCLANEIRKTAQTVPKSTIKSTKDLPPVKCQVAEETIAKKLNFPIEEHLYRDLIALNVREEDIVPAIGDRPSSRVWKKFPKDKEPQLSDFFKPQPMPEYCCIPKVIVKPIGKIQSYDGLSLYKRQQLWNMSRPEDT
ncbi:uncharacterized protein LOC126236113 isoform X1 [Schistocerca nitens]|uniref:uncharacterized protein LOC126236113 isoform X1 n=1 Tax=Schistocerca nitens TaxID=7011 RepID=UPI0021186296|nr:uncharacterized protein LOC126236113 isoform X1 [Schistocerca nitens]